MNDPRTDPHRLWAYYQARLLGESPLPTTADEWDALAARFPVPPASELQSGG